MTDTILTIQLPSLIHRLGGPHAKEAKSVSEQCGCALKRIRRSRHWQITGQPEALAALSLSLKQQASEPMRFITNKIDLGLAAHAATLESSEARLQRLLQEQPELTLHELIQITQCSLAEARRARFDVETMI